MTDLQGDSADRMAKVAALVDAAVATDGARRAEKTSPSSQSETTRFLHAVVQWPWGFAMTEAGLVFAPSGDEPPLWICGPFDVLGKSRDSANGTWGYVLAFADDDGIEKTVTISAAETMGDGAAVRQRLAAQGLAMSGRRVAKEKLIEALCGLKCDARVRLLDRAGWSDDFAYFAMPGRTFGTDERIVFDASPRVAGFGEQRTLADWQSWVSARVAGHDRLLFSIAVALTGPLLGLVGAESAIWHHVGRSSTGKSTALTVGASVWGGPSFVSSWRGTANAFEVTAALASDLLLVLDELGVADARSVGDSVYMLANGVAKSRMASDGSLRTVRRWRTNTLSSGELGLSDKMGEDGRRSIVAGQAVRFIELAIDPARALGIFDGDGSKEEAAAMASGIKAASAEAYGTAGPAFLERLLEDTGHAVLSVRQLVDLFMGAYVPPGADSQTMRVAQKFALVGAAGDLARDWGILPAKAFKFGDSSAAAGRLFLEWLAARGGVGCADARHAIARIRGFLQMHASARLPPLRGDGDDVRTSFRAQMVAGYADAKHYYLNDRGMREALEGLDLRTAAQALFDAGLLTKDGRHFKVKVATPEGRQRLFKIDRSILTEDETDD